jgi:hypothetical protein
MVQRVLDIVDRSVSYGCVSLTWHLIREDDLRRPQPSRTSSHSCVLFRRVSFSMSSSRVSRFCTLNAFVLNRSSVTHSGFPSLLQMMPYRRSLPPPRRMSPSDVLKALYGTMEAVEDQCLSSYEGARHTMRSSPPPGVSLAANETRTGDICECGYLAVTQSNVNMLALTCLHST